MKQTAKTIELSKISRIQIYHNVSKYTEAQLNKILEDSGGDIAFNGPIFLWGTYSACCHLKSDGKVICAPIDKYTGKVYTTYGMAWNTDLSFYGMQKLPCDKDNYVETTHLIVNGQKIDKPPYRPDMGGNKYRTAIGRKQGRFAYYVSQNPMTPEKLRDLLYSYGWEEAMMLDGGGSTCYIDKDGLKFVSDAKRIIPYYIVVHLAKETPAPVETENDKKRNKVLSISAGEAGTTELPAGSNKVKYNTWYYGREVSGSAYPWCMAFIQWVFTQADLPLPVRTASCTTLANYARAHGQWVTKDFKPGDILFMHWSKSSTATEHVGIVKSIEATYVKTVEGNTSLTSQDNGGAVMNRNRAYANITGAYRPWYNM